MTVLGQICCDSNGKLNAQSVLLEAGIEQGGQQVPVDLSELTEYSLFPGQVIKLDVKVKVTEGFVPTSCFCNELFVFMHRCIGVQSDTDEHVEAGGSLLCLCTEVSVQQVIWPPRETEHAKDVGRRLARRPTESSYNHERVFKGSLPQT